MARKPVDVLARPPKPTGRQAIWSSVRRRGSFSVADIAGDTDVHRDTIRSYLRALEAAGFVERTATPGAFSPDSYELVKDIGAEAPRVRADGSQVVQGLANESLWRTMKRVGVFTIEELALLARTDDVPVSDETAKSYVRYLQLAGYVAETSPGGPGKPARYRFVASRDPGPLPPQVQRVKQVFDPNAGDVVWASQGADS